MLKSALVIVALLLACITSLGQQRVVQFPTTDEIKLVVSQAEQAFKQYEKSVAMERTLQAAEQDPASLKKDQEIVEMSYGLIAALREHPEKVSRSRRSHLAVVTGRRIQKCGSLLQYGVG